MDCSEGCPTAAVMFGVPGVRVLAAVPEPDGLDLVVETDQTVTGCGRCGVLAAAHGRREQVLHDAPFGHRRVRLRWRKRLWRCRQAACATGTFTEVHDLAGPRAVLTARAVVWATDALAEDDTTVSALARRLGVDWHTLWHAVKVEAERRLARPDRLAGVSALGVDEHVWRPGRFGAGRDVTGMVDLSRDQDGRVRARLLDLVPGRSGPAYRAWLDGREEIFRAGVKQAALDPFRGYANALRDSLSDVVQVLDAFHVVKLGTQVVDEVRRRVQQDTLHRRGHKHDPLYRIRGLLRHGAEHLTDRQQRRLAAGLHAGDPQGEVELARACYQQLRQIYSGPQPAAARRALAEKVIAGFPSCPVPEVARLGRSVTRSSVMSVINHLSMAPTARIRGPVDSGVPGLCYSRPAGQLLMGPRHPLRPLSVRRLTQRWGGQRVDDRVRGPAAGGGN